MPGSRDRYRFIWDLASATGQAPDHFTLTYNINNSGNVVVARVTTPHWEPVAGLGPGASYWYVINCIVGATSHYYPFKSGTTPAA